MSKFALLPDRGILAVGGEDRVAFLQGLVSNDVERCAKGEAIHAALLTAQGRYLHDFLIVPRGEELLLDTEAARLPDLLKKLSLYKLRSKVTLADARDRYDVAVVWGDAKPTSQAELIAFADPRLAELGSRIIAPKGKAASILAGAGLSQADAGEWDRLRMSLGVPDGSRDLPVDKALLLENGFDELHGVDWNKGCYMGQELTARMKYRALVRKRLLPVIIEGPTPPPGTPIMAGGQEAGEMRSAREGVGLALMRLEFIDRPLSVASVRVTAKKPGWMLPQS